MRPRLRPGRIVLYLLLVALAAFYLLPIYVLVNNGLKSFQEVSLSRMWEPPSRVGLDSFARAYERLAPNFRNSVLLVVPATLVTAALGSINGYLLAKWKFTGADVVFPLLLFGMFIPYQSVLIPLVQTLQWLGRTLGIRLYGTIGGLALVHIIYGIPITTLIFRNYYATVPTEVVEAARIDGAGLLGIYRDVILPLSVPGFVVVIIWQVTQVWNEFLFAVTITSNPARQPVQVALQNLAGSQIVEWNVQMAGALLTALPTLLVYIFLGRYFLRGLLAGALKG
ncbi:MAG: carbohydrate ABC transporter permease [Armatimonadota bacterium]|nr:carbohydrate ABC transporter permease [Armatimonadota bacterium]MDR7468234.1 carbohydrate ABC transporter permease [Armatimonadota bacterium]MDR7495228.1 carbohydrate ABC transporter permease [Armatimonadota bacterium]MDR7505674.1 carbohydrate ABC transporter permease [Armatimonadota bacterium]MDR7573246.1 carbohydrate ABC transporter permease [Armatimonadota bacterium]